MGKCWKWRPGRGVPRKGADFGPFTRLLFAESVSVIKKRRRRSAAKFREETSKKAAEKTHAAVQYVRQIGLCMQVFFCNAAMP
jgi:hypothetical protein